MRQQRHRRIGEHAAALAVERLDARGCCMVFCLYHPVGIARASTARHTARLFIPAILRLLRAARHLVFTTTPVRDVSPPRRLLLLLILSRLIASCTPIHRAETCRCDSLSQRSPFLASNARVHLARPAFLFLSLHVFVKFLTHMCFWQRFYLDRGLFFLRPTKIDPRPPQPFFFPADSVSVARSQFYHLLLKDLIHFVPEHPTSLRLRFLHFAKLETRPAGFFEFSMP